MACATGGPSRRNKRPGALLYRFRFLLPRVFSPWGVFCPYQSSCALWSLRCGTKIDRYSQVFIDSRYNSSIAPLCGLLVSPRIAELIGMRYDSLFLSSARNPPECCSPVSVSANEPSFLPSLEACWFCDLVRVDETLLQKPSLGSFKCNLETFLFPKLSTRHVFPFRAAVVIRLKSVCCPF